MTQTVQDAYRIVFNDMLNSGCGLLVGTYDAAHGSQEYMNGIFTVMEWIAYRVSKADGENFNSVFFDNMTMSRIKANIEATPKDCTTCKQFENCGCDDLRGREYLRREGKDCYK